MGMLKNQRAFREDGVEARFRWLEKVDRELEGSDSLEAGQKPQPRAKQKSGRQRVLVESAELRRPEASLRPPIGDVPKDATECNMSETFRTVYDEMALVNPFG